MRCANCGAGLNAEDRFCGECGQAVPPADARPADRGEFDVILSTAGENKIQVIKVVRELTGLGLKDAKDLVESAPNPVKTMVTKAEAEDIRKKLEEVGAKVQVK